MEFAKFFQETGEEFLPGDYTIGDGHIRLSESDGQCELTILNKRILLNRADDDSHLIIGRVENICQLLTVNPIAVLEINGQLEVTSEESIGHLWVDGHLEIRDGGTLSIDEEGYVYIGDKGTLTLQAGSNLIIEGEGILEIIGTIYVDKSLVPIFIHHTSIRTSLSTDIRIAEIEHARTYSLRDYLRSPQVIDHLITREDNTIEINGSVVLGDFTLAVIGNLSQPIPGSIGAITISDQGTLYITESYQRYPYYFPRLYLTKSNESEESGGRINICGKLIVDGNSKIDYDNYGTLCIEQGGELHLRDQATLRNLDKTGRLIVKGTLFIDSLEQFAGDHPSRSIRIEGHGKIVIINPPPNDYERKILFTVPEGIKTSRLYELFGDRLHQVEYHIQKYCGFKFDTGTSKPLAWYADLLWEEALRLGLLKWHDLAFIELDHSLFPWLQSENGLPQLTRLFMTFGADDRQKLNNLVQVLRKGGCGNVLFRLVNGNRVQEFVLNLETATFSSLTYDEKNDQFHLRTSGDGTLSLTKGKEGESFNIPIIHNQATFKLPEVRI